MNPSLDGLIGQFRAAQDIAVATLTNRLRIPRPKMDRDCPSICRKYRIDGYCQRDGVSIYSHGFGIELKIGDLTIDFDWGENGEPDGFDAWRLYNYTIDNRDTIVCTHAGVELWLEEAFAAGELVQTKNLYYDPSRRASLHVALT